MADKCLMFLLGLISLCSFHSGTNGVEGIHVFCSSGENVNLPCNYALSDCTSTSWNYDRLTHLETVDLVVKGKMKNNIERGERLSLGSDCSLNIKKVAQDDYGIYGCRQQGTDGHVYLHVLHVFSSSSQTELRPGSSLTLYCQLHSYDRFPCETLVRNEGVQLIWVNQDGVSVMTDSRYQISFSQSNCISTLTTKILNEDLNRGWRCQVTQRNQPKTSDTFTVKYSAPPEAKTQTPVTSSKKTTTVIKPVTSAQPADIMTRGIPVHSTSTPNFPKPAHPAKQIPHSEIFPLVMVVIVPALAVLLPAVMLWVIYTKKTDTKEEAVDPDLLTYVTYSGIPAEKVSKRAIYSF